MSRRSNGEGTMAQRPDGLWQGRLRLSDGTRRSFYGKTKTDVAKKLREAHRNDEKGLPIPSERYKVKEFLEE